MGVSLSQKRRRITTIQRLFNVSYSNTACLISASLYFPQWKGNYSHVTTWTTTKGLAIISTSGFIGRAPAESNTEPCAGWMPGGWIEGVWTVGGQWWREGEGGGRLLLSVCVLWTLLLNAIFMYTVPTLLYPTVLHCHTFTADLQHEVERADVCQEVLWL